MYRAIPGGLLLSLSLTVLAGAIVAAAPPMSPAPSQDTPRRVFITDSQSWEMSGGFGGSSAGFGGAVKGGARPQTAEIIKTFGEKCPGTTVTMNQHRANFVVLMDHEGGKGWARKDNKVAVFDQVGDAILSKSTRSLGNSVKEACKAIMEAPLRAPEPPPAETAPAPLTPKAAPAAQPEGGDLSPAKIETEILIRSEPSGADIVVDGKFVGSTPSSLKLSPGDHDVLVETRGFKSWRRTLTVRERSSVSLNARLEKE